MDDRAGITSTSKTSHEEMKQKALKRDDEQVQAIGWHLNEAMTDPFQIPLKLPYVCLMENSPFSKADLPGPDTTFRKIK
jgi:flavin-binding protein dodecin